MGTLTFKKDFIMKDLLLNGFIVFQKDKKFIVKKESVPDNTLVIKEQEFDTYELALEAANQLLKTPPLQEWEGVVRYNQGLGIEYKNLQTIFANNKDEAKLQFLKIAENIFKSSKFGIVDIKEIKVLKK